MSNTSSKLLFDEQPIVIDRVIAKIIGLNEAIIIQQVHYWLKNNEAIHRSGKSKINHFHDGRFWTFNSVQEWHENEFSFWSVDTVKRTLAKLVKMGIFITGNYNAKKWDRTLWYSIDYDKLNVMVAEMKSENALIGAKSPNAMPISANCSNAEVQDAPIDMVENASMHEVQNALMEEGNMHQPIPETTLKNSTKNTTEISAENTYPTAPSFIDSYKWNNALDIVRREIKDISFNTWFTTVKFQSLSDQGILRIVVPNEFTKNFYVDRFGKLLQSAMVESGIYVIAINCMIE